MVLEREEALVRAEVRAEVQRQIDLMRIQAQEQILKERIYQEEYDKVFGMRDFMRNW